MKKVNNITDIHNDKQNGKQAVLGLHFAYMCKSRLTLFWFLVLNDEYILVIAADIDS